MLLVLFVVVVAVGLVVVEMVVLAMVVSSVTRKDPKVAAKRVAIPTDT